MILRRAASLDYLLNCWLAAGPAKVDPDKIDLKVEFYDLIDAEKRGHAEGRNTMKFPAKPFHWIGHQKQSAEHPFVSEAVVVEYHLPEAKADGKRRRYHGYTAELYCDGVLQAVTAKPSKLLRIAE